MDREKIDEFLETGILVLVLSILVFGPLALGGNRFWALLTIQGLTLGVMGLWLVRLWVNPSPKFLFPPVCWAVLAFMGYAVWRYLYADVEYIARWEMIRVLIYGFLFLAITNNLHKQDSTQIIAITLVGLAMLIAAYACYQFVAKSWYVYRIDNTFYRGRGSGTFICPNSAAGFLEMILPLGLCFVFVGRLSHVSKVILAYASLVILAGIVATVSRGGWAVTAVVLAVLGVVLFMQRDYRIYGLMLVGVIAGGLAFLVPRLEFMQKRITATLSTGHAEDLRFALWEPAWKMWLDNFWFGVGPAHFDVRFPAYRPVQVQMRPDWAHNDYLNTLAEWGLAGALIVAAAFVLLYWGVFNAWRGVRGGRDDFSRKKSNKFAFFIGSSIGIMAVLLHSLVDFDMHIPADAILAVTLMALLSSQWRFATERYWFRAATGLRIAGSVILLSGLAWLGVTGWRGANECRFLMMSDREYTPKIPYSYARLAWLEKAFQVEPKNPQTAFDAGQCYWTKSRYGDDENYHELGRKAIEWFEISKKLNPYNAEPWFTEGMCIDWVGKHSDGTREDSSACFQKANELDPNNCDVAACTGWHYVQIGDMSAARTCFERSKRLEWVEKRNEIPYQYGKVVEPYLLHEAEKQKD
jgi:O-antigen ligase